MGWGGVGAAQHRVQALLSSQLMRADQGRAPAAIFRSPQKAHPITTVSPITTPGRQKGWGGRDGVGL